MIKLSSFIIFSLLLIVGCSFKEAHVNVEVKLHDKILSFDIPKPKEHKVDFIYPDHTKDSYFLINEYKFSQSSSLKIITPLISPSDCIEDSVSFSRYVGKIKDENKYADNFEIEIKRCPDGAIFLLFYNQGCFIKGCFKEEYFTAQINNVDDRSIIQSIANSVMIK